jgi:hypothetical protein
VLLIEPPRVDSTPNLCGKREYMSSARFARNQKQYTQLHRQGLAKVAPVIGSEFRILGLSYPCLSETIRNRTSHKTTLSRFISARSQSEGISDRSITIHPHTYWCLNKRVVTRAFRACSIHVLFISVESYHNLKYVHIGIVKMGRLERMYH